MASRLTNFITANSLLNDYQFGFRQHQSTSLALIDVIDNIHPVTPCPEKNGPPKQNAVTCTIYNTIQ